MADQTHTSLTHANSVPDWLDDVAAVSMALGDDAFESRLMALLNRILPVDHCAVFTFDPQGHAGHLFTSTKMPADEAETLAHDYISGYYAQDPNFQAVQNLSRDTSSPFVELSPPDFEGHYNRDYRKRFFDRVDLIDKAAAVTRLKEGVVYCNFYRMGGSGKFSEEDRARLNKVLPLVTSLIGSHYRLRRAQSFGHESQHAATTGGGAQSLVHSVIGRAVPPFDRLTAREREVCARILLGYTTEAISLDLDIAPTSVATYRKRAYAKLGIATQNELFGICLDAVDRTAHPR
ncbi:MAG: LuxR family transcriptional regulator [Alphaproteobacteria bacterium]|nr:MAG: LuxR family transcriptional regulator [Alphaproteobacteria bacterium]